MEGEGESGAELAQMDVDVVGYIDATVLELGPIVAACVGAFFAFQVVKWSMYWARNIGYDRNDDDEGGRV
jgi:hypothetical protein